MTHCLSNQVEKPRGREHHAPGRAFFFTLRLPIAAHRSPHHPLHRSHPFRPPCRFPSCRPVFLHPATPVAAPYNTIPIAPSFSPSRHPTPAPSNTISVAPSFPIPPSCSRTIHFHPLCSILLHPPVPRAHRPSPSPFFRPFSLCKKENRKNFKKMQKRC